MKQPDTDALPPVTVEQSTAAAAILQREYETNPRYRALIDARVAAKIKAAAA
jgi:hypothetical protein